MAVEQQGERFTVEVVSTAYGSTHKVSFKGDPNIVRPQVVKALRDAADEIERMGKPPI